MPTSWLYDKNVFAGMIGIEEPVDFDVADVSTAAAELELLGAFAVVVRREHSSAILASVVLLRLAAARRALPLSTCTRLFICESARSLNMPMAFWPNIAGELPAVDVDAIFDVRTTELPEAFWYGIASGSLGVVGKARKDVDRLSSVMGGRSPSNGTPSTYSAQARSRILAGSMVDWLAADGRRNFSYNTGHSAPSFGAKAYSLTMIVRCLFVASSMSRYLEPGLK